MPIRCGRTGAPGHLFVAFRVARDPVFTREGSDVFVSVPISISEAVLGGTVVVPTLSGDVEMKVPAGTQSGESSKPHKQPLSADYEILSSCLQYPREVGVGVW